MTIVLVLPESDLKEKFIQDIYGFILNWTFLKFLGFCEKIPLIRKNCFNEQGEFWTYLKMFRTKRTNFKAIWVILAHSKPKIFSVGQLGDLGPPTILQLLRPCVITKNFTFLANWKLNLIN